MTAEDLASGGTPKLICLESVTNTGRQYIWPLDNQTKPKEPVLDTYGAQGIKGCISTNASEWFVINRMLQKHNNQSVQQQQQRFHQLILKRTCSVFLN